MRRGCCSAVQWKLEEVGAHGGVDGYVANGGRGDVDMGAGTKGQVRRGEWCGCGVGGGIGESRQGGLERIQQSTAELAADGEYRTAAGVDTCRRGDRRGKRSSLDCRCDRQGSGGGRFVAVEGEQYEVESIADGPRGNLRA